MAWIKSSRCDSNVCVRVWPGHRTAWVRDELGTVLVVEREDWQQFLANLPERPR